MRSVIFTQNGFTLVKEIRPNRTNGNIEMLNVIPSDLAEKHVVNVQLLSEYQPYEDRSVKLKYMYVYITHGIRGSMDSFSDIEEYIKVLQDALEFAKRVEQYIKDNGWT